MPVARILLREALLPEAIGVWPMRGTAVIAFMTVGLAVIATREGRIAHILGSS